MSQTGLAHLPLPQGRRGLPVDDLLHRPQENRGCSGGAGTCCALKGGAVFESTQSSQSSQSTATGLLYRIRMRLWRLGRLCRLL